MTIEFIAIVEAVWSYLPLTSGCKVKYYCDNTGVVGICDKMFTEVPYLSKYCSMFANSVNYYDQHAVVSYIRTPPKRQSKAHRAAPDWLSDDNRLADSLSRGWLKDFVACCKSYKPNEYTNHIKLDTMSCILFRSIKVHNPMATKH